VIVAQTDLGLRHILKLTQVSLIFDPLEDILSDWLHSRPNPVIFESQHVCDSES
jgi:hypothetical protein